MSQRIERAGAATSDSGDVDASRVREARAQVDHAAWERIASEATHDPRVAIQIAPIGREIDFRILGCSCGWQVPDGSQVPDEDIAVHAALARMSKIWSADRGPDQAVEQKQQQHEDDVAESAVPATTIECGPVRARRAPRAPRSGGTSDHDPVLSG